MWPWLAGLALVFVGIRLAGLGQVYHHDEAIVAVMVEPSRWTLAPGAIGHPPLGEMLYALGARLAGSERLRVIPLAFSLVNLGLVYALARALYGERAARWATALFTFGVYSVLASLQVDYDGAILPTFLLLTLLAYVKLSAGGEGWGRWAAWLLAGLALGFLTKLTFGLVVMTLIADHLLTTEAGGRTTRALASIAGLAAVAVLAVLVVLQLTTSFSLAVPAAYVAQFFQLRFLNFGERSLGGLAVGVVRAVLLISPWGLLLLLGTREWRRYRLFYIYLALNLVFYLAVFDFSTRPLDRYFMFVLVPLAVVGGDVLARRIGPLSWRAAVGVGLALLAGVAVAVALQLLPHRLLPLSSGPAGASKLAYVAEAVRLRWDFLLVFTGGSGPLGFYVSAHFVFLSWLIALAVAAWSARHGRWQRAMAIALFVTGAVYNAAFIEEYLGGLFNGNASAVTRAAVARALADPEVRTVMTYNDAGAYELQEGGKYASGFLAEPAYEGVKPKRLEAFRGHVLVVEMPVLTRQSDRWVYLTSRCHSRWELHSKRIPAHLFDCRDVNLAGSAGRWG